MSVRPYTFHQTHRVAIVPHVANLAAPTLAEVAAGVTIHGQLTRDGLAIERTGRTIARPRWSADLEADAPTTYAMSVTLRAYRARAGERERLWNLAAAYRQPAVLIVRRGLASTTAFAAGQRVEAIRFRWGKRSTRPSADNEAVTFTVPLHPFADNDEAILA